MFKNKQFILTVILPIFISIILGIIIISLNSTVVIDMRAKASVNKETNQMEADIKAFEDQKITLLYTAAELDKKIENNRIILDEIQALKTELENYDADISNANKTIGELDKNIEQKTKYNNNLNTINNQTTSSSHVYSNTKLNVPGDISAGRYTATGTGKLFIYTIANTLKDKQDLSLLDSNSYTFNISSGQYIKIEGTLTLINTN